MFQMITKNFEDYPEHRLKFFSLLRAIATHCFPALIRLSSEVRVSICVPLLMLVLIYTFQIWQGCNLGLHQFRCVCLVFKYLASTGLTVSMSFFCFFIYSTQQLKLVMDSIIWAFRHTERNISETGLILLLEMLKNFQVWFAMGSFWYSVFLPLAQGNRFHRPNGCLAGFWVL